MFSSVAGIGLGLSFPPTVILCFISFAISLSSPPGLLTRQPEASSKELTSKRFQAVDISFFLASPIQARAKHSVCRESQRLRTYYLDDKGRGSDQLEHRLNH